MLLLSIHLMLATSLALLPSFLAGEEMDRLVRLVREQVEAMEGRVRGEVIRQMEEQMEKREVLLMAEMARLEERLSPTRREKRQHSQKLSQKKTAKSESSFTKVLQKNEEESEQQTNQSAQNGHTNPQFNSSEVKMTMMLKKQKLFLLNVIGEREEALEQRLTAKSRRGAEELGTRIDGLEEVLVKNISDQGAQHKTWANYEIEKLNGRIAIVAEDSKTAVDKIETVDKEIERMEATRLVEMEMVEERLRESKLAMEVELNRTKELLEREKTLVRKELRDMEMLLSNKMEASLVPLRSQVERALEEPPRLASCAYQGAWNTTGTVTYSTALLEHRCGYQPTTDDVLSCCPSSLCLCSGQERRMGAGS